jgi:hypothetical protein
MRGDDIQKPSRNLSGHGFMISFGNHKERK